MFATTVYPLIQAEPVDSEREWDTALDAELPPIDPFPFFDLPPELRLRVYQLLLKQPNTIDLDRTNIKMIAPELKLFRVSRQMHEEGYRVFYGQNSFRVFATVPPYFDGKVNLLMRLKPYQRACITSLELRLGPGFTKPPRSWSVASPRLGLKDCKEVRTLKIFVEFDPMGHEVFREWRLADDGFSVYCKTLLHKLMERIPTIERIEFDAWTHVKKKGKLMTALLTEAKAAGKIITYGPERGWTHVDFPEDEEEPSAADLTDAQILLTGRPVGPQDLPATPVTLIQA